MSKMIERVAQALNELANTRYNAHMLGKDECLDLARAAIEAMREPTEEMQVSGATQNVTVAHTADHKGRCLTPALLWRAMIDAALK